MASFVITGTSSTPQTLDEFEAGLIGPNGYLFMGPGVSEAPCVTVHGPGGLVVQGSIVNFGADGAVATTFSQPASLFDLQVAATGSIWGWFSAVDIGIAERGATPGELELTNEGSIVGGVTGITIAAANTIDAEVRIENSGTIQGRDHAIAMTAALGHLTATNIGRIAATEGPALLVTSSLGARIVNDGTIWTGSDSWAIQMVGVGDDYLRNTGRIVGNIALGSGNDTLDGRGGIILGEVNAGLGNDLIYLGDGSVRIVETSIGGQDTVVAEGDATLGDWVEVLVLAGLRDSMGVGNAQANLITGNAGDNRLLGGAGNDTLQGGLGDDRIGGGAGIDVVDFSLTVEGVVVDLGARTAEGSEIGFDTVAHVEVVRGGDGADVLQGAQAAEALSGGRGDDTLRGGGGADSLQGDRGADVLTGQAGPDVFVYVALTDSNTFLGSDLITDFKPEDVIDLSVIDANTGVVLNQAFAWVGTAAFSGAGQLRYEQDVLARVTRVLGDVDGNGLIDIRIELDGLKELAARDFVL